MLALQFATATANLASHFFYAFGVKLWSCAWVSKHV
jgi:hypothetical protein